MEKSVEQWLKELPVEVSNKAIANTEEHFMGLTHCKELKEALTIAFDFDNSNEGYSYWNAICHNLNDGIDDSILIFDLETTNYTPDTGSIVEFGIASLNLETGSIEVVFDNLMHQTGISRLEVERSWIIENSSMTVEDVQHSLHIDNYFDELQAIFDLYSNGATAFNKEFDFRFTDDAGLNIPNRLDCPMVLSKPIVNAINKNGGVKNPSVQETYDYFFPYSGYVEDHRAGSDAKHEAELVYQLHKLGHYQIK